MAPEAYREQALGLEFRSYEIGGDTFHGIAMPTPPDIAAFIQKTYPQAVPTLSFFRKSPEGQTEPHFIHTDVGMGSWTAILYLTPEPPAEDGTTFWVHKASNTLESAEPLEHLEEGSTASGWTPWTKVTAMFNRMVMFPVEFYHSRSIFENFGEGDTARLTQVVFGTGDLWEQE
jgi:hypothetical protein